MGKSTVKKKSISPPPTSTGTKTNNPQSTDNMNTPQRPPKTTVIVSPSAAKETEHRSQSSSTSANASQKRSPPSDNSSDEDQRTKRSCGPHFSDSEDSSFGEESKSNNDTVESNNYIIRAIDQNLNSGRIFNYNRPVSIEALLDEEKKKIPRNTYIDLQLLRVLGNSNLNSGSMARVYMSCTQSSDTKNYNCLFLFKVVSKAENNRLVYMLEATNTNQHLWTRNPLYRDNGIISIGTIIV